MNQAGAYGQPMGQFVEQFQSLTLGAGGQPGQPGDVGVDTSQYPRPPCETPEPLSPQSCNPLSMRLTVNALPGTASLKQRFGMPIGAVVRPYASLPEGTPVVSFGQGGILRCRRCRTYVNPWFRFTDGGRRFRCNMCGNLNDVPMEYFCTLDAEGRRRDWMERPELYSGSVEFVAGEEYLVRPPMPPSFFFVIDVSWNAVSSGMLSTVCSTIKAALDQLPGDSRTQVGFLTFDSTLHFYNLRPGLPQPQMMVVAELDEPFLPLPEDLLVNLSESRAAVDALLDMLPTAFGNTQNVESATGPALRSVYMAMSHIGGKLLLFQSTLPSIGVGRLRARDDARLYGTEKEASLRGAGDPFYKKFSAECSRVQISVDVFCSAAPYADIASLSVLSKYTSGEVHHFPGFTAERDGAKLSADLRQTLTRNTVWESVVRIRIGKGFRINSFHGHFFVRASDLLALPCMDADKAFAVQITHEDTAMTGIQQTFMQCALLHTTSTGERRIRVHTLFVPVVQDANEMLRSVDTGAMVALMARLAVEKSQLSKLQDTRDKMTQQTIAGLKEFRQANAAAARTFNRLIFPESMRLLPLYTLALTKCAALRGGAQDVHADERSAVGYDLCALPVEETLALLYPTMYALHMLPPERREEKLLLPPTMPLSGDCIDSRGAYLVDNGRVLLLWLGKMLSPEFLGGLFGTGAIPADAGTLELAPPESSSIAAQVHAIIAHIRAQHTTHQRLLIVAQGQPSETALFPFLVEDRGSSISYTDFYLQLHRQVQSSGNASS